MISRRRLTVATALAGLAAILLLTPRSEDPDSTLALRRFLQNLGLEVSEREGLPSAGGTLVLVADIRSPDEAQPILDWAQAGGNLVVADPTSEMVGMVGASVGASLGFVGVLDIEPSCVAPVVVGVDRIVARATDRILIADDPAIISCFHAGDGALMLTRAFGSGTITLIGGHSPFTNELLREADNAVLAAGVSGAGSDVVFGPPTTSLPGSSGIWEALPQAARAALLAIVLSTIGFALVRARRLGGPIVEEPITPIAGSELVHAAGRLYRRSRATGYAGLLMRQAAMARLSRRFATTDAGQLASALARVSGIPRDRVEKILATDPRDDGELMALGADLESLSVKAEK